MSFQAIGVALHTELQSMVTDGYLGTVYNYDMKVDENTQTPCVVITPQAGLEVSLDSASNESEIPFSVRVIDQGTDDRPDVENNIRMLADRVMEKLKAMGPITYHNGCVKTVSYSFNWGWIIGDVPYRVFELLVNFVTIEDG